MRPEDVEYLKFLIMYRRPFRIGKKGICLDFRFNGHNWFGSIPRGGITLYFSILRISNNEDHTFSAECPGWCPLKLSLNDYDNLTELFA